MSSSPLDTTPGFAQRVREMRGADLTRDLARQIVERGEPAFVNTLRSKSNPPMSDHYNAVVVVFEHDIKDEHAERTLDAIRQIRGVLSVEPNVADIGDHIAESRAKSEMRRRLITALDPE